MADDRMTDLGKGATGAKPADGSTRTATSGPSVSTGAPSTASPLACEGHHDFTDPVVIRTVQRQGSVLFRTDVEASKAVVFCRRCGRIIAFGNSIENVPDV